MDTTLKYWPIIVALVAVCFALQKQADENAKRDEQIRVLQNVIVSEHPEYTLVLFPPK